MACDCIQKLEKSFKSDYLQKEPKIYNIEQIIVPTIDVGNPEQESTFSNIRVVYWDDVNRKMKTESYRFAHKFCPFCGTEY